MAPTTLTRAVSVSKEIAIHMVLVDAIDERAKTFYLKYGFIPLESQPLTLFLPIKTILMAYPEN
jgi:hypothetical protein